MRGIYIYTNKLNSMQYVGKSENVLGKRPTDHIRLHQNSFIARVIRSEGLENFDIQIFPHENIRLWELQEVERRLIFELETVFPMGYNKQLPKHIADLPLFFFHKAGIYAGYYEHQIICDGCNGRLDIHTVKAEKKLCDTCIKRIENDMMDCYLLPTGRCGLGT